MLEKYMNKHGLTRQQVAKDLGITPMHVGRLLKGHKITLKVAMRIHEAYGLDAKKLMVECVPVEMAK